MSGSRTSDPMPVDLEDLWIRFGGFWMFLVVLPLKQNKNMRILQAHNLWLVVQPRL